MCCVGLNWFDVCMLLFVVYCCVRGVCFVGVCDVVRCCGVVCCGLLTIECACLFCFVL